MAIYHMEGLSIRTDPAPSPLAIRGLKWIATDDATYDYDQPIGFGATESEAIADLIEEIEWRAA